MRFFELLERGATFYSGTGCLGFGSILYLLRDGIVPNQYFLHLLFTPVMQYSVAESRRSPSILSEAPAPKSTDHMSIDTRTATISNQMSDLVIGQPSHVSTTSSVRAVREAH
jgi:hypothetical protein